MNIIRKKEIDFIKEKFKDIPIVAILGPRQCGKTTLAQNLKRLLKIVEIPK